MFVPPAYVFAPLKIIVPAPVLVSAPVPAIAPVHERSVSVWKVPPPALMVTVRLEVNAAVFCSVPPLKVTVLAAAPRLPSLEIERVPCRICQLVTAVVVFVSVQVLVPVF
jgi:hypothetical protein